MPRLPRIPLGPFAKPWRMIRRTLPPANFITIHYAYFIATCLLCAIIFWGANTPDKTVRVNFTDSLFLTTSAMTLAGLNTVNLSQLNTFQQILLFLLIMLGSAIWVSAFVVHVRKKAFETKFRDIAEMQRNRRRHRSRSMSRTKSWSLSRHSTDMTRYEEEARTSDVARGRSPERERLHADDGPARKASLDAQGSKSSGPSSDENKGDGEDVAALPQPLGEELTRTLSERLGRTVNTIRFAGDTRFAPHTPAGPAPSIRRQSTSIFAMYGVGARRTSTMATTSSVVPRRQVTDSSPYHPETDQHDRVRAWHSIEGWVGRNSTFYGLTEKEREKLGGYEYRAVTFLAWLVPAYFVAWQLLGALACAAWTANYRPESSRANGLNPWWVGAFNAISAFNNSGMSLLDANMTAYQTAYYLLITMSLLILAGNTCFPIFLRLIIWTMWKTISSEQYFPGEGWSERAKTLRFLLDHPRRCYTNLFPSQHTWWLLAAIFILNGTDWAAFEILNIGNEQLASIPANVRVIDGLFQAFAVRSGGFYVVSITSLRISLQVLYVVMMYISVYPVVITMRNSNVYEERSLGIYSEDQNDGPDGGQGTTKQPGGGIEGGGLLRRAKTFRSMLHGAGAGKESNSHFVRQQLRAQLAHDAWWIVLALILIMIIENASFTANPVVFSVFNFIFEIVSAYGCVGISTGVPWAAYSFSGSWRTLSKLILCAVMLRGRHRGLPVAIDKAVLLPGEENAEAEEEDGRIRLERARTLTKGRDAGF